MKTRAYPYNILDVARICGLKKIGNERSGTQDYVCPFCGSKDRSFAVTAYRGSELKNKYKCLRTSCQAAGNMHQLYMRLNGLPEDREGYEAADKAICEYLGTMPAEVIADSDEDEPEYVDCASDEVLNAVYREMWKHLPLLNEHKADLKRRGLSEKHYRNFRSVPTDRDDRQRICRLIMHAGYSLRGVPGFYRNKYGEWDMNVWDKWRGYFIPAINERGYMCGMQVRLDNPSKKAKYLFFSSSSKDLGTSSGARNMYLFREPMPETVFFTEGLLKSYIISALGGVSIVGVPGISQKRAIIEALKILKKRGVKQVVDLFDMDRFINPICDCKYDADKCNGCTCGLVAYGKHNCPHKVNKRAGLQKCSDFLKNQVERRKMKYIAPTWNLEGDNWNGKSKGFDDYLIDSPEAARQLLNKSICLEMMK